MTIPFNDEFKMALHLAFRTFIPKPEDRIPLTISNAPAWLGLLAPFMFMAYAARRPHTHLIRLLLLPANATCILAFGYRWMWTIPQLNVYNWAQSLLAWVLLGKSLQYALSPQGVLKVNENDVPLPSTHISVLPPYLYDAFELAFSQRDHRFKFNKGTYLPHSNRSTERSAFLVQTASSFLKNFLILDFFESCIKLVPGVGQSEGGSIFYEHLPTPARYVVSTTIHMFTGTSLLAGFGMVYDLISFLAVLLLDSSPAAWHPVLDGPWTADSLHTLWSKRWHQLLRPTFMIFGGLPGHFIAGDVGLILGMFLASGLFHEASIYTMGRGFSIKPLIFFTGQGPLLILERAFRIITGRRVHGRFGMLWVWFVMFILAQPMIDSWHVRGLGSGLVIPPFISPTRLILTPLYRRFLDYQRAKHSMP